MYDRQIVRVLYANLRASRISHQTFELAFDELPSDYVIAVANSDNPMDFMNKKKAIKVFYKLVLYFLTVKSNKIN